MKKILLAALAALTLAAAPATAFAQQNPTQPAGGILSVINCLLTCHHHHTWFTGSSAAGHSKPFKHTKFKYSKPKFGNYGKQPSYRGFSGFNKGPQYGFGRSFRFSGFSKGPQFFGKATKLGYSKFGGHKKFGHFKPHKPAKTAGVTRHSSHGFPFAVGAMICTAAGPMINAALGGPEPTPEQMLLHMAGCFIPPLGVVLMLQDLGAL